MCGIIGLLPYSEVDSKAEKIRQESMIFLATELLQLTQARGKDATGIFALYNDCNFSGLKMGISATEFINRFEDTEESYKGFLNAWRKNTAKIVIGHCRKPSTGFSASVYDNNNNHPIKSGKIIGVHNGTLDNSEEIFSRLTCKRHGKVDSEAIFSLLNYFTHDGNEPFTTGVLKETCRRTKGLYSVLALNINNPYQLAAFRDTRPLEGLLIRPLKLLVLASEKEYLKTVVFRYNKMANLYNAKFVPLTQDDIDIESFADDSLYLFDNRQGITNKTNISDLYVTEKIVRTDKIWTETEKKSYTTNYKNVVATPKTSCVTNINTEKNVNKSKGLNYKANNKKQGMVFDTVARKFKDKIDNENVASGKLDGNVEIDCDDTGITHITPSSKDCDPPNIPNKPLSQRSGKENLDNTKTSLKLAESETDLDMLLYEPAIIKVIEPKEQNKLVAQKPINLAPVEVDMTVKDVTLFSKAVIAMNKITPFKSNLDLINAIDVASIDILKTMDYYPLANRIKRMFYRDGWYDGYQLAKKELSKDVPLRQLVERYKNKHQKARGLISNMKSFTHLLASLANEDTTIENVINDAKEQGIKLNSDSLTQIFSRGDKLGHPVIESLLTAIKSSAPAEVCIACNNTGISSIGGPCIACENKRKATNNSVILLNYEEH